MDSLEDYRQKVVADLFSTESFKTAWSIWETSIMKSTSNLSDGQKVYDLGSKLSSIFQQTTTAGRGQSTLSAAGNVWEGLVCWYLNVVFSGSRAIAIKQKKRLIPSCISDAATINYTNYQTNTESDLVVIVVPDDFQFPKNASVEKLSQALSSVLNQVEFGVVQCKTNWNDNAQIPMLWDMIYRAKGFKDHNVSVGRNSHSIADMREFTYSFVSVPTQKKPYKPTDMAVKRVRALSGGNFWGKPTQNGVALSLSEIFARNFKSAFDQPIQTSISNAIANKQGVFGMK